MVFALAVSFPLAGDGNEFYLMLSSLFSLIFYLCLLYTLTWDLGFNDSLKIEAGRMKFDPLLGGKISLGANVVNIILAVIILITSFIPAVGSVYSNSSAIATFIQAYYAGLKSYFFSGLIANSEPSYIYLLMIIPSLLSSTLGYIMGAKKKRILFFLPLPSTKEERTRI